ncbi:hypothetical protein V5O48_006958 [Marasmius crinis-equi]|uniref:Uncharacterized protein n=1 Tax=Marasmius crinis-equi TaxID=585013 RepID=A0ABR3FI32_9AGAR
MPTPHLRAGSSACALEHLSNLSKSYGKGGREDSLGVLSQPGSEDGSSVDGNFNQNNGNCQTFTVNNYGNSGSGSGSNSNNNSGGSSGGGLLGSLTGKNGLLGSLGLF